MNHIETMKQALEALEKDSPWREETITSLRKALSEAQLSVNENSHAIEQAEKQEPVAWMIWLYGLAGLFEHKQLAELEFSRRNEEYPNEERKLVPLYTTSQQREWVELTQQDIDIAFDDTQEGGGFNEFAEAIEQILRRKNT